MKNIKKIGIIIILCLLNIFIISFNTNAAYEIQNIVFEPENPIEKSSVIITVSVIDLGENDEIYLFIKECDGNTGICDEPRNITLTKIDGSDNYNAVVDLTFSGATYLDYWYEIYYNGEWIRDPEGLTDVYGPVQYGQVNGNGDTNGGTTNGGNGDDNGTPGFELVIMLIAIIIGIIWFKTKRLR